MSTDLIASLNSLPVELIHNILNYLDTQTTFLSLNKVCKRLKTIIETYHRYQLDFCLISKSNFYSISCLIYCQNIISLTISDGYQNRGQIQYFFQLFNLDQFTQIRSLTLLEINRHDISKVLKSQIMFLLHSLKVQFRERFCLQHEASITLASHIEKSILKKIDINLWFCSIKNIIWPSECILEYVKIHTCSLEGYITILERTPRLQTFILNDLDYSERKYGRSKPPIFETFQSLKSLTLENCHRYMHQIEYFLLFTPSLIHLKIISDTNLLDGYRWEQYIQRNLPLLKTFEFFFVFYPANNDIELIMKPYQTLFWLEIKQWFVTCAISRQLFYDEDEQRTWCTVNYSLKLKGYDTFINLFHFLTPFIINFFSALIIIIQVFRTRAKSQANVTRKSLLFAQIKRHKHLLISPCITILLVLPRLIISLMSRCMESARDPWLLLTGYYISSVPPLLISAIFILPSEKYTDEFLTVIRRKRTTAQ